MIFYSFIDVIYRKNTDPSLNADLYQTLEWSNIYVYYLAEWRSGSVSALLCERPGFASRIRPREIIPANNCTMQGQHNWGDGALSGMGGASLTNEVPEVM